MPKTKKTNGRKRRGKKNRTEKYKKRLRKKLETRKKFPLKSPNQNYQKKTSSRRAELLRKMFNMSMASYNRESTPKSIPTPKKTPETPVTPDLVPEGEQTSRTTSAKKPPPQKTPPVNLSFNINNVMSPRKMGPRLPTVRCSGRLTEEKCKEDKNCKWDYGAKKCREKPPSLNLNI